MGHIVATCYNRGICETFFPIRGAPALNPHVRIMCLGLIPDHFLHVYLKDGCPLPPSCMEWSNHKIDEAEQWKFAFMDRQSLFKDIMSNEPKPSKKPTNHLSPIYSDTLTPEKPKGEFEVIKEDEDDSLSLAS
jgi:hypothetical protein